MDWSETKAFLSPCFPEEMRAELELLYPGELREIRVRVGQPTTLVTASRTASLQWRPSKDAVERLAEALADHGLYARGGDPAGLCNTTRWASPGPVRPSAHRGGPCACPA